jgi:hypothetical protein
MVRYTPEIANEICERLAQGESLRAICEDPNLPTEGAVRKWAREEPEGFGTHYAQARLHGYEVLADEILHIADTPQTGQKVTSKEWGEEIAEADMIEHRRLQVDTRKWMLSKMLPKIYGDKQHVEHSGAIDTSGAILAARKRSGN